MNFERLWVYLLIIISTTSAGLLEALQYDDHALIDQTIDEVKTMCPSAILDIYGTQAPGLIYAFQNETFSKAIFDAFGSPYGWCTREISSFTVSSYRTSANQWEFRKAAGTFKNRTLGQRIHRAFIVAIPEIINRLRSDEMFFEYNSGSYFLDAIHLLKMKHRLNGTLFQDHCKTIFDTRAEVEPSIRLSLACFGSLNRIDRAKLIMLSLAQGDFDIAFAALRVLLAEIDDQSNLEFEQMISNFILPSLESGYHPFPRFVVSKFLKHPRSVVCIDGLDPFYHILAPMFPPVDFMNFRAGEYDNLPLFLAVTYTTGDDWIRMELDRLVSYLGVANVLWIYHRLKLIKLM